jgi:hypothetical protein
MPKEVCYNLPESKVNDIFKLCAAIQYPNVEYSPDQLDMANCVIRKNQANALTIVQILEEVTR